MYKVVLSRHDLKDVQEVKCASWVIVGNFLELRGINNEPCMVIFVHISVIREFMSFNLSGKDETPATN
jgi:hypothetical protein